MDYLLSIKNLFQNYYTDDFVYRPFVKADTFPLFDATKISSFNEYLLWDAPTNIDELKEQIDMLLREQIMNKHLLISCCSLPLCTWVAFIKLTNFYDGLELSLWIHPHYWENKNYFQISNFILKLIFLKNNIPFVYFRIHEKNIKMQKIANNFYFKHIEKTFLTHQNQQKLPFDIYRLEKDIWINNFSSYYSLLDF